MWMWKGQRTDAGCCGKLAGDVSQINKWCHTYERVGFYHTYACWRRHHTDAEKCVATMHWRESTCEWVWVISCICMFMKHRYRPIQNGAFLPRIGGRAHVWVGRVTSYTWMLTQNKYRCRKVQWQEIMAHCRESTHMSESGYVVNMHVDKDKRPIQHSALNGRLAGDLSHINESCHTPRWRFAIVGAQSLASSSRYPETVTIVQYRFNKTKQHAHTYEWIG